MNYIYKDYYTKPTNDFLTSHPQVDRQDL